MDSPGNIRRFRQLYEAALNLGMSESDARYYASDTLNKELSTGEWRVSPQSAEAKANDVP